MGLLRISLPFMKFPSKIFVIPGWRGCWCSKVTESRKLWVVYWQYFGSTEKQHLVSNISGADGGRRTHQGSREETGRRKSRRECCHKNQQRREFLKGKGKCPCLHSRITCQSTALVGLGRDKLGAYNVTLKEAITVRIMKCRVNTERKCLLKFCFLDASFASPWSQPCWAQHCIRYFGDNKQWDTIPALEKFKV